MEKKEKFGDFFGRSERAEKPEQKARKPVGFFDVGSPPKARSDAPAPKTFFATPEEAQREREEQEQQRQQKIEEKRQAKRRKEEQARLAREEAERQKQAKIDAREAAKRKKLADAKARKLAKEKEKKDKTFIREQEKIITQQKRDDAREAARAKRHGYKVRGSRFYSTEARQEALDNFKKYGSTTRPLQPNQAMVRKVLDIYAQIEL